MKNYLFCFDYKFSDKQYINFVYASDKEQAISKFAIKFPNVWINDKEISILLETEDYVLAAQILKKLYPLGIEPLIY
jgi:hypothetical protein